MGTKSPEDWLAEQVWQALERRSRLQLLEDRLQAYDLPDTKLAYGDQGFSLHGALGHAVRQHGERIESPEPVNMPRLQIFPHRKRVQEKRLLGGSLRLLRRHAVEDGLRVYRRIVFDRSAGTAVPLKQLTRRGRTSFDLIQRGRNEVALAYGVKQTQQLGRIGRAHHP